LASVRSWSITRDSVEVALVIGAEVFKGTGGADGEVVESVLVANEQHAPLLENPAPDVQGKLLEDLDVEIAPGEVIEPLLARLQPGGRADFEDDTDVDIRSRSGIAASFTANRMTANTSASRSARATSRRSRLSTSSFMAT
jgi:hypothetical protein